jgi:DNA-binding response OmpR family regulator
MLARPDFWVYSARLRKAFSNNQQILRSFPKRGTALLAALIVDLARGADMRQVVLVIESNNHAGKFFKSCLEQGGYYAIATDDVNKALKVARAWQPDLIMIDMHLAGNATEWLIKNIKSDSDNPPRIILTVCDTSEKATALTSQVDAVIPKPLDCWRIAAAVGELLDKSSRVGVKGEFIASVDRSVKQVSASPAA